MTQVHRSFKITLKIKDKLFFTLNPFIFNPVSWIFNAPDKSFELAAQGMMMDRETEKGMSLAVPINSISTGFSLSQGNRQHHSEAPKTKLIYTR